MNSRAKLDTHVMAPTQELAIRGYQSGANLYIVSHGVPSINISWHGAYRNASLIITSLSFLEGDC